MENTYNLGIAIAGVLPLFSGLTWLILLLFSLRNYATRFELRAKQTLFCFILFTSLRWFASFIHADQPLLYKDITPLAVATALFSTVLYFKFITLITRGDTTFSKWHYLIPVMLFVTDLMLKIGRAHV